MNAFLLHEGKAALLLAAFWLCWRLLLQRETFHRLNRAVLLGAAAFTQVLPLCVITVDRLVELQPMEPMPLDGEAAASAGTWWQPLLLVLYLCGVALVLARLLGSTLRIRRVIRSSRQAPQPDGTVLCISDAADTPFSWMKWIVVSPADADNPAILAHEKAHSALGHSRDLLFIDLVTSLQWFNPVVWMLRQDLRALHEYEADEKVLEGGVDARDYQYLLVRKAYAAAGYSVANSFRHSSLKGRITMMCKDRSPHRNVWKVLYVLPLVALSLVATAQTRYTYIGRQAPEMDLEAGLVPFTLLREPAYVVRVGGEGTWYWLSSRRLNLRGFDTTVITGFSVYEGDEAVNRFGERARGGVIELTVQDATALAGLPIELERK